MTQTQIKYYYQKNKLITEFMETPFIIEGRVPFLYSDEEPFPYTERDFNLNLVKDEVRSEIEAFGNTLNIYTRSYHSSWDWLMPVVAKIEKLGFDFCIADKSVFIRREYDYWEVYKDANKIEAVWTAVVDFVEWYNKQKIK